MPFFDKKNQTKIHYWRKIFKELTDSVSNQPVPPSSAEEFEPWLWAEQLYCCKLYFSPFHFINKYLKVLGKSAYSLFVLLWDEIFYLKKKKKFCKRENTASCSDLLLSYAKLLFLRLALYSSNAICITDITFFFS